MPAHTIGDKLTVRAERFALLLALGETKVDAYRQTHKIKGKSEQAINDAAGRLAHKPRIAARCATVLAEMRITDLDCAGSWWADLAGFIKKASAAANWTAVAALMRLRGQGLGVLAETVVLRQEDSLSDAELVKRLAGRDPGKTATLLGVLGRRDTFEPFKKAS